MRAKTLLTGRAGSGRTRRLLDRLAGAVAGGREESALLLVPTVSQAGHLKRLLLSRTPDLAGFFDLSVVTFTGLAERVLPGRPIGELLSGARRDLLLRRALAAGAARSFGPAARYPGFRRAALGLLKELKQNGLAPEELAERLRRAAEERRGAARRRLEAFRELFVAYEALREEAGLIDHEDYLRLARDVLGEPSCPLRLALLGVDGFPNFTRLERDLLLALVRRADESVVTLPWDPDLEAEEGRQFRVAAETRAFLLSRGFREEALPGSRRARPASLRALERELFGPGEGRIRDDGGLLVLEGADPDDEADRAARAVLREVRDGGRRYRDVLVVMRDTRVSGPRLGAAFRRHGLPFRVHGPMSLGHLPYLRACRALFRVAAGDDDPARVRGLLRSGHFAALDRETADRLEVELIENGAPDDAEGWARRLSPWSAEAAEIFAGDRIPEEPAPPDALRDRFLALADRHLAPLWRRDPAAEDEVSVKLEARAVRALREGLVETARALAPEGPATPRRFLEELEETLREAAAALPDRRLDVVNLIDAREARQWEAPVVVVAGLVEGIFPRRPREDPFLADRDREELNRSGSLSLRERLLERDEERYLFYVAATRARDRLVLTRPATDGRGTETLASHFLVQVLRLVHPDHVGRIVSARRLSDALPRQEEIASREDLRRLALHGISEPFRRGTPEARRAGLAAALHDLLAGEDAPYRRALARGLRHRDLLPAALAGPAPLVRFAARGHSASSLEDFAQCPFLHFSRRVLGLRPLPEDSGAALDPPLLGEVAHEVLRRFLAPALAGRDPDPASLPETFREVFDELARHVPLDLVGELARRDLEAVLSEVARREAARLAGSRFSPALLEWDFSFPAGRARDGREVLLRGRVDRVDRGPEGAVVIDYKYSARGFDRSRRDGVAEGSHLQLPIYLLAVRDALGTPPMGAWLYPLRRPRTSGFAVEGGPAPDEAVTLDAAALDELLLATADRVLGFDGRIRAGEVAIRPRDRGRCAGCDYADLCRLESWQEVQP